ncbi:hypothetical protein BOX15_Mlig016142g2, partial [Macrostomum lignano]
ILLFSEFLLSLEPIIVLHISMDVSAKTAISKLAESLHKQTNFTKKECEHLLHMYRELAGADDVKLDRSKFKDILHCSFGMTDAMMIDHVFRAFDTDFDSSISQEEWLKGMSTFLRGTLDEKTQFAFRAYDLNSNGMISREEIFQLLKATLIKQPVEEDPDEGVRDLVEIVFKKFDTQKKGVIDYAQFKAMVAEEPLLLQALGPCLPDEKSADAFLCTFEELHLPTTISYIKTGSQR